MSIPPVTRSDLCLLPLHLSGSSQQQSSFTQDIETGHKTCDPNYDLLEGLIPLRYQGPTENGLVQGKGKIVFTDWSVYKGYLSAGKMEGRGVIRLTKRGCYEGEFVDGKMHGEGTFENRWIIFAGNFVLGVKEGKGKQFYKDTNAMYTGLFSRGLREGQGVLTFPSGAIYRGSFANDQIVGSGVLEYNGKKYTIRWVK